MALWHCRRACQLADLSDGAGAPPPYTHILLPDLLTSVASSSSASSMLATRISPWLMKG